MLSTVILGASALAVLTAGYAIPNADGFPKPSNQQTLVIETQADGRLSDAPPPAKLSQAGITNFQLIAFNEQFEVAFFSSLIENMTHNVQGFEMQRQRRGAEMLEILKTVKAQEELHALTATTTLEHFNASLVPQPCQYKFPTSTFSEAIDLASTFTSVVLGTLQDAQQSFAKAGDLGPVRALASVVGQEGEQNGFYRTVLNRKPSSKPFLTTNVAPFAYSALQSFIVSCPFNVEDIPIMIFPPLNLVTTAQAKDMMLSFSVDLSKASKSAAKNVADIRGGFFVTYLTGQQQPISVPIQNGKNNGNILTFDAEFPFTKNLMSGLTIAALTNRDSFTDVVDLPGGTIAAPALINVNEALVVLE